EQSGQPYIPPIINQDDILRLAAIIVSEDMLASNQRTTRNESSQTSSSPVSEESTENGKSLQSTSTQTTSVSSTDHNSQTDLSLKPNRIVPNVVYKHPSVHKLIKQYENIVLPSEVLKSDISPVISLDSSEVSDWYAEQVTNIRKKFTNIVIKKIPGNSAPVPSSSSDENLKSKSYVPQISTPSNDINNSPNNKDSDNMDEVQCVASCQNENDASIINVAPTTTNAVQQSAVTVRKVAKKRTTRKLSTRKRSINDDDVDEVIPEKKNRNFSNKRPKNVSNKVDLPIQLPSDKKEQKDIFTSSLELVSVPPQPAGDIPSASPSSLSKSTDSMSHTLSSMLATPVTPSPNSELDPVASLFEQVDCQNVMATEKTLSVFVCSVCSRLFYTKKQLQDHERIHLT
ncbi:hypothetical protein ILUMI_17085, partial [Ignelater luminosus]